MKKLILAIVLIFATLNVYSEETGWGENLPCDYLEHGTDWNSHQGMPLKINGCHFLIEYYTGNVSGGVPDQYQIVNIHLLTDDPNCFGANLPEYFVYQHALVKLFSYYGKRGDYTPWRQVSVYKADCITTWFRDIIPNPNNDNHIIVNADIDGIFPIINIEELVGPVLLSLPSPNDPLILPVFGGWNNCDDQVCCVKSYTLGFRPGKRLETVWPIIDGYWHPRPICPNPFCTPSCDWLYFRWTNGVFGQGYPKESLIRENYNILSLYPNPTKSELSIKLNNYKEGVVLLEVFDLNGKNIYNKIIEPSNNILNFEVNENSGVYLYQITYSSGEIYTGQFTVVK